MKFLYISLLILFVTNIFGQQPDAEYLSVKKTYTVNRDGTFKVHYSHQLKYNSYLAINRLFGETFIEYDSKAQTLHINKCFTTKPNGNIINAPKNAFNEILPSFAAHSGTYNNLREMVVTHTGLERGVVVTLDYDLNSKINKTGFFSGSEYTVFKIPYKKLTYVFKTPKDYPLSFSGNMGDFNEKIVNNSIVYTFSYNDVQPQSQLPYASTTLSVLHFSDGTSFTKQLSLVFKDFNNTSTQLNTVPLNTVRSTYDNFINKARLINIPVKFQKIPIPSSDEVLSENSGSLIELASAFMDVLNKQKINSQLVLSVPKYKFNDDSTSVYDINDVFVKVMTADAGSVLFPMNKSEKINSNKFNLSNNYIACDSNKWIVFEDAEVNSFSGDCDIDVNDSTYKLNYKYTGVFSELNKPRIANLSNSKFDNKENTFVSNGTIKSEVKGCFTIVNLPFLQNGVFAVVYKQLPQNENYDIELKHLMKQHFSYNIKLSKGSSLAKIPKDTLIENKYFKFSCNFIKKDGYVKVNHDVELNSLIIPKEYYNQFRDMLGFVLDDNYYKFVLYKN